MHIRVLAVGTKMPGWVEQGVAEYAKRLPGEMKFQFVEINPGKRGKGADIQRAIEAESKAILSGISDRDWVVALDLTGKPWSTEQLAWHLTDWQHSGNDVVFLIGGPDGLSQACLQRANQRWSLSALTYPHPLVRIILVEQLYRAVSINTNHPYHR